MVAELLSIYESVMPAMHTRHYGARLPEKLESSKEMVFVKQCGLMGAKMCAINNIYNNENYINNKNNDNYLLLLLL